MRTFIMNLRVRAATNPLVASTGLRTEELSKAQVTMVFLHQPLARELQEPLYPVPLENEEEEDRVTISMDSTDDETVGEA
jgi:hypothetical protein